MGMADDKQPCGRVASCHDRWMQAKQEVPGCVRLNLRANAKFG